MKHAQMHAHEHTQGYTRARTHLARVVPARSTSNTVVLLSVVYHSQSSRSDEMSAIRHV